MASECPNQAETCNGVLPCYFERVYRLYASLANGPFGYDCFDTRCVVGFGDYCLEVDVRTFLEHDSDKFAVSFPGREMHGEFHLHLEQ